MKNRPHARLGLASALVLVALVLLTYVPFALSDDPDKPAPAPTQESEQNEKQNRNRIVRRSPLALSTDGTRLLTANQTAGTVSLVDTQAGQVLAEVATGDKPAGVAFAKDGRRGVVTHWYGYDLAILEVGADTLKVVGRVEVGPEPRGVVIGDDGKTAYVAVGVSNEVVRVDLETREVTGQAAGGRARTARAGRSRPTGLICSSAMRRSQSLSLIAVRLLDGRADRADPRGQHQAGCFQRRRPDGLHRQPAEQRVRHHPQQHRPGLGGRPVPDPRRDRRRRAVFDPDTRHPGKAAADVYGVAAARDGRYLAVSCGGTHEIMIFRTDLKPITWRSGSSRDLIDPALLKTDGRYRRLTVGAAPPSWRSRRMARRSTSQTISMTRFRSSTPKRPS